MATHKTSLVRLNEGIFRPWERPALAWLAAHMPQRVTPDNLTAVGVVGAVVVSIGYGLSGSYPALLWLATLGLVINWFGDSLDGTVARYRKIERPRFGYYLDNAIDCIVLLPVVVGMGLSGYFRFDVCFLALAIYTMMSALTFLRANITDVFQISYSGFGPTETRAALAMLNMAIFIFPPAPFVLFGVIFKYPDLIIMGWSSATIVVYLVCMTVQARQLAIEEPARRNEPSLRELPTGASSQSTGSDELEAQATGQAVCPNQTIAPAR
jgi:phosphatidylglycerophosphate synthase